MVYNSLYYTAVFACNILNYLCFGQVLLIENESDVSQNNRAENTRNDDFYVAYVREDSSESRYNKPDDADAALIDVLNNLGLRSQTPYNLYINKNNYSQKDQRHIKGNKINLHRGDVILHNISTRKPKTNVKKPSKKGKSKKSRKPKTNDKKPSKKGKSKKPSKKGETNDIPSGSPISPGVDDVVKIAADLYEKLLKLNEQGETKINNINIHNRGKHQNTNHDDHDHDHKPHDHGPHEDQPHDQKPYDQDDENDSPFEKWIEKTQANDKTKHKKGGKGKNKNTQANDDENLMPEIGSGNGKDENDEIDLLFHEITVATSTILDLVHKVGFNDNGCAEIERSAKYIATLAESKCMVS